MKYFSNKVLDKKIKEEGSGGDYTAGEGIDISENEISIDSDTLDDIADGAEARGYFDANGILSTSRDPFWQIGETSGLVELKSAYSYVGAKKGIIFSVNQNEDVNAHLEVVYKTMAGASNPIPVLHSRLPFYSDSFVSAGGLSPGGGGGGGGATSLEGLDDVEYTGTPIAGQALVYVIRDGVGLWTNATPTGGGTVTTVANVPPTSGGDIPKAELSAALGIGTVTQGDSQLVTGGTVYSAINSALSSVLKFVGVTTTAISDGSTTNPVIINGSSYTAVTGNVVLYGAKEYLWTGSAWEELGDEASWALKTITITGTGYLTGGGSLEANRTIDIANSVKTKIEHGESAYNRTDWDQYLGIDANGHIYVKDNRGFYSYSFVSAGGVGSSGGGGGGATELADLEDINFVTPITGGQVLMYRDLGGGDGEWYNAYIEVGGVKTVANVVPTSGGNIPLADLASAFTTGGYKLTDHEYTNGPGLSLSNGTFSLTQAVQTSLRKADTAIQTVYDLVIKNSAGTTQLTYKPATSGTYSITLTKAMVGLGDVENTKLSTWAGSGNITTVGMISGGTWQGTPVGYNYVAAHYIGGTRTASAAGQATLLGIDAISNAQSSGSSDLSRIVWDATNNAWHFFGNLYADGFVSAGGMSDSGGGGGASNLYDLLDMSSTISDKPSGTGQKIIVFNPNGTDKQNRSGAWEYANMPTGSVTSVAGVSPVNGDIPVASLQTAIGLGDYLPKSGGTMTGNITMGANAIVFNATTSSTWANPRDSGLRILNTVGNSATGVPSNYAVGLSVSGYYGFQLANTDASNTFVIRGTSNGTSGAELDWVTLYHSGNLTKSVLTGLLDASGGYYLPLAGGTISSTSGIPLAINTSNTTQNYLQFQIGGTDLGNVGPYASIGMVLQGNSSSYLAVLKNNGGLRFYDGTAARTVYHSGNFSVTLNGSSTTAASFYAPTSSGTANQVLISGGSNTAPKWASLNLGSATKPIYLSGGILTEGTALDSMAYEAVGSWTRKYIRGHGSGDTSYTGATFMATFVNDISVIDRGTWSYANNGYIDTGVGKIDLTGTMVVAINNNGNYGSAIFVTPSTTDKSGNVNEMFFFTQNGNSASYPDAWTRVMTNRNFTSVIGSTTYAPYLAAGYVSRAGDTITSAFGVPLVINTSDATSNYINFQFSGTENGNVGPYASIGMVLQGNSSSYLAVLKNNGGLRFYDGTAARTVYHSGNSNKSDVAWACSTLTASTGVVSPELYAKSDAYPSMSFADSTQNRWIFSKRSTQNHLHLIRYTSSQTYDTVMAFDYTNGYVGMGTTSPGAKFHVYNGDSIFGNSSTAGGRVKIVGVDATSSNYALTIVNSAGTGLFYVRNDGNNGIGTNAPDARFHIAGTSGQTLLRLSGPSSYGTSTYNYLNFGTDNVAGIEILWGSNFKSRAGDLHWYYTNGMSFGGAWNSNHIFFTSTGSIVSVGDQAISSDINLKTNLAPVTYSVEDIAKTRAVTFDWKDGRGHSAGSIAQDWKPLIPELVHGEEGNMTLAYGQIALVNSILLAKHETEQDKEIRKLKARVRDLEKQLKMRS